MMKIAFVTNGLGLGGAERQLLLLIQHIQQAGHTCQVISLGRGNTLLAAYREAGILVTEVMPQSHKFSPAKVIALRRTLQEFGPDIVQGWMYYGNVMATLATRLLTPKPILVWGMRGMSGTLPNVDYTQRLLHKMGALLAGRADAIIHNSKASVDAHERALGYPSHSSRIIANGFDTDLYAPHAAARDDFRKSLGIGDDQFLIGWLGRYHPHKDVANMLRAYQIIHRTHPAIKLVMAGKEMLDSNPALSQTLHELGLSGQVMLLGPVAAPQTFLQSLDALALSSQTENFPNVIGEAMATAVPCVATDVGDCAQLIGDTGEVVPAQSPDQLAAALIALSTLPGSERAAQAARARARIVADFSIAASCKAYLQHYQHLLQQRK